MNGGKPPGFVYLIHFDQPIGNPGTSHGQAQHYTGHTGDLDGRTGDHHGANAAAIMRAVNQQGIGWRVVRTWEGTRDTERAIKNMNAGNRLCPECTPNPLSAAAAIARAQEIHRARQAAREATRPLPRNRDGSISRSRTTDAQKAAAGVMTAAQQAEHTALHRGLVTGKPSCPAERGPLDIDPWAAPQPRHPERDHELEAAG